MNKQETQVISVANLKGGVGKTTTAVSISAGLAMQGFRTVLVDLDSHLSASLNFLTPEEISKYPSLIDVLDRKVDFLNAAIPTHIRGLSVVLPGETQQRLERERENSRWEGKWDGKILFDVVEKTKSQGIDYMVIDTPPSVDSLTIGAISASQWILVPVTCEYLPLLGLKRFSQVLVHIRETTGRCPKILGYLMTMVDRRERITWEVENILLKTFGNQVFSTQIRVDTKVKVCPSHRKTIFEFEGEYGRASSDYLNLVKEIIERTGILV